MTFQDWLVLVVEDDYDSTKMVAKVLEHHQIRYDTVGNGAECIQALERFIPTLIVMDLAMPVMDGWRTLSEIRANPNTAHIPVVAITAYSSPNVAADAQLAGFDGYFPKPLHPIRFVQELVKIVEQG
ncbi:MAG: response regulator [Anaerolineae bacterium]|nr:response regulator [Anaerolineae bacterium]